MNLFPRTQYVNNLRSFKALWYNEHNWLEYSPKIDRGFRFPCRMFHSSSGLNVGQIDKTFSLTGFKNWNNATTKFRIHQASKSHFNSNQSKADFLNSKSIDVVLDESKTL
ncbi:zinc finger MYM-type protein 1-like [Aphis craccivora]|uniref:Zinc finger MYM-type protein 1-like n=1 Tax=Aphis craccivora TaxID=307492 RepID=A0A6G0Y6V8_APHCR|nr:zinc finger MYM-type protein 1-like [Aphis craccivora]